MPNITRPMLAVDYDPAILVLPVIASPKIDGLRCVKVDGKALTRSFKPIPNNYIRTLIEKELPDGIDGELTAGSNFRESTGSVRSEYGCPDFTYWVFDYVEGALSEPFNVRVSRLMYLELPTWCRKVPQKLITTMSELEEFENQCLAEGFEGVMLRKPNGPYKCNRSTLKEGYLLKVKRFVDGEATIEGFYEQEANENESVVNELGTSHRSSHQSGKVGKGTLGGVIVRDVETSVVFRIGTGVGWTVEWRQQVYDSQVDYVGRVVKYKHLPHGNYDVPRNASMQGFREEWDL